MTIAYPITPAVEFRDVLDFPGYCVGDDGSVWSRWTRSRKWYDSWHQLKPTSITGGYLAVNLCRDGEHFLTRVHRLVLTAFVGPCPPGMEGCHFPDRNRSNNRLANLRWDTGAANCADRKAHGTDQRGERNPKAKLTEADVRAIRELSGSGMGYGAIASLRDCDPTTISRIVRRRTWAHVDAGAAFASLFKRR